MTDKNAEETTSREEKEAKQPLTIDDLGWTLEEAAQIRGQFAAFAEDWDDPAMDVYDKL